MHGAGRFGLTQLANVDKLPEHGAIVIATPLKIQRGSGSPVRVIAVAPAAR
jgi:kynurenine formamidase